MRNEIFYLILHCEILAVSAKDAFEYHLEKLLYKALFLTGTADFTVLKLGTENWD